jgi:glutamate racemase
MTTPPTIGVFDSGFGGLTVLRALLPLAPGAHFVYLGDTARLPYGSKSRETISRYAVSSARFLHEQGADLLVIACNTASALALEDIKAALPIPVIGVIQPGAEAALNASSKEAVILSAAKDPRISPEAPPNPTESHTHPAATAEGPVVAHLRAPKKHQDTPPHILVLATAATTQSHAYTQALTALNLKATEKACPLLVPLVEEGWIDHPVTAEVLRIYLLEALAEAPKATTLLLGCTHYPLLKPLIETTLHTMHHPMHIIDSAQATAHAVATHLPPIDSTAPAVCTFYATDSIEKFQHLGSNFLGQPLTEVSLINLGG